MSDGSTERLLDELARDLSPVRRLPPLRVPLAGSLAALVLAVMLSAGFGAALPGRVSGVPWGRPPYLLLLVALLVTSGGALLAAVAHAVPGREAAARWGGWIAAAGGAALLGGAIWWLVDAVPHEASLPLASSLGCTLHAAGLGLAPGAVIGGFLARALDPGRLASAALASVGAVGLGAAAVHAGCADGGALHVVLGHCAAPFLVGLALGLPLAVWLRGATRAA